MDKDFDNFSRFVLIVTVIIALALVGALVVSAKLIYWLWGG